MLETILGVYFLGFLFTLVFLIKFAHSSATSGDLFTGAAIWPATLLFGLKEWINK